MRRRLYGGVAALSLLLLTTGCQQEMARQPAPRPLASTPFFREGRSARQLEPGVTPRGYLRDDDELYRGVKPGPGPGLPEWFAQLGSAVPRAPNYTTEFPFAITDEVMERGRVRYNVYCAVCHDRVGTGYGRIVMRGYIKPPSFHGKRLTDAPEGYFFQVISDGHGAMPAYADQIPPQDRWAIIAYVRALQFSQDVTKDKVDKEEWDRLKKEAAR
jgi:mono/diheme cytochrome c family protein